MAEALDWPRIDRGAGAPAMILVPGFACGREDWQAQVEALSQDRRVVAVDLPGHGGNPPPEEAGVAAWARGLAAFRRRHVPGPVVLVGHSMACRVVTECQAIDPQGVVGLVLVDGSLSGAGAPDDAVAAAAERIAALGGVEAFLKMSFDDMLLGPPSAALADAMLPRFLSLPRDLALASLLDVVRYDAGRSAARLAAIRVPLCVIQSTDRGADGRRIRVGSPEESAWIAFVRRHAPHAEAHTVQPAGHFPQIDQPAVVNAILQGFAGRCR